MSAQYYLKSAGKTLSATQIERRTGVNPDTYGSVGLATLGIYNIVETVQPFNIRLFDVALTYTLSGSNATETWTATAKSSLTQPKVDAVKQLVEQGHGHTLSLIKESGIGFRLFVTVASMLAGDRPARFAPWFTRRQAVVTRLATNITAADAASTADAINDIVSPAWGNINLTVSGNDLSASDFVTDKFYSKNLTKGDFELYFPQTDKTVTYSSGFAATTGVFTDTDKTVQIRRTSNSLVVDEFCVGLGGIFEFGYRKHEGSDRTASFY